jgi:transposase
MTEKMRTSNFERPTSNFEMTFPTNGGRGERPDRIPARSCDVKRRRYSLEFKDQACALVIKTGHSAATAAQELGIAHQTLGRWLKLRGHQLTVEHEPTSESDDPVVLKAQMKELLARVRRLEMEKDILKKATAFFASQST